VAQDREDDESLNPDDELDPGDDELDLDNELDDGLELDDDIEFVDLDLNDVDLDDEGLDLKEALGLPDRLPALRLPPEPELAAMSRASSLLGQAHRLAEWVGVGRELTEEEELTAADTAAAARELDILVPVQVDVVQALPGMPDMPVIAGMWDVPELARLWDIAFDAGFLEVDPVAGRVQPGEDIRSWPDGTDGEVLEVWSFALPSVLRQLQDEAEFDDRVDDLPDFTDAGWGLVMMLFLARAEGVPVQEASDIIREASTEELTPEQAASAWQTWTESYGDPAEYLLGQLAELNAVSLTDEGDEGEQGPVAWLTPLGTWAMREQLIDADVEIPLLPPPDQMTAADLLNAAHGLDEAETEAETAAWLASRAPETAAREMLAVAAGASAPERMFAVSTVQKLGAAAEPAWRDALDQPELRPYAKIALTEIAGGEPGVSAPADLEPDTEDIAWLLIDMVAAMSDDPEDLQLISDTIPEGQEPEVFEAMSLSPHPDAADALSLIGQHHPDKRLAKAARTSAHRAASRPKPPR